MNYDKEEKVNLPFPERGNYGTALQKVRNTLLRKSTSKRDGINSLYTQVEERLNPKKENSKKESKKADDEVPKPKTNLRPTRHSVSNETKKFVDKKTGKTTNRKLTVREQVQERLTELRVTDKVVSAYKLL